MSNETENDHGPSSDAAAGYTADELLDFLLEGFFEHEHTGQPALEWKYQEGVTLDEVMEKGVADALLKRRQRLKKERGWAV